jgi:hypothetical protein
MIQRTMKTQKSNMNVAYRHLWMPAGKEEALRSEKKELKLVTKSYSKKPKSCWMRAYNSNNLLIIFAPNTAARRAILAVQDNGEIFYGTSSLADL